MSHERQQIAVNTALKYITWFSWLLELNGCTVFLYFWPDLLASSPITVPFTKYIFLRKKFIRKRSSTIGISFIRTRLKWLCLPPSNSVTNKLNSCEKSASGYWLPCKKRARALKRHIFLFLGLLVHCSKVKHLIDWFFKKASSKTASLHPKCRYWVKQQTL